MQQVETANRSVNEIDHRALKGSGARFQNGDTLLARITPCLENGKTAFVDFLDDGEMGHGSTEFIVLSGIEGVSDDLFVYYLTRYPEFRNFAIIRMEGSSGRQRVPAPTLKKYTFACPSYDEQRAIAHILGSLDGKIELNRRMNQTLESTARAIFKSWFVDFDPVRAKAEGRPTGLPDDVAALFPESFEDSELGKIPRGREVVPLPEIIDVNPARTLKKGQIAPYLEMKNMPENSARALDWYDREFGSGMKFTNGDTLMARITPCLEDGKGAFVDFLEDGQVGWGSTEYIVLPLEYS
jgi:type I restriction enzyme S subunit